MTQRRPLGLTMISAALLAGTFAAAPSFAAGDFPITQGQRQTAQQVAQAGVPLSELAPNAPDTYTVKAGDTLWAISGLFLKSPWRWPELWGMNTDQIRNPHLIYPGQVLMLIKADGRARLQLGRDVGAGGPGGTVKLSPRVRAESLYDGSIAAIPQHLIEPFLNEAVVLTGNELETAPRLVSAQENRVWMTKGDRAYARGNLPADANSFRVFREPRPLRDPVTKEVLGYEAVYVGTADLIRAGSGGGTKDEVPATLTLTLNRIEAQPGDRLAPVPERGYTSYVPHAPQGEISGSIISVYGDAITAGQNQIVALNKGKQDGLERGHVLALWHAGRVVRDPTTARREEIRLPDERHGQLFVFQVFDRVSYALILTVQEPVVAGDRFTQP
ncbi:LysM peptidoglycan-binding domain-containing protein [Roseateles chitinivorans]|uniref:LysM peptidoglycan-binding domain-containing protein n=1 Tax=Roseateles chitinivorans TaxID=2917965 RepID=UPI003D663DFA